MEINVGNYVRTKKGIGKIKQFLGGENDINYYEVDKNGTHQPLDCFIDIVFENEIIKSSPNIIDLIEIKDFVTFQCISCDYDFEYMEYYTNQINSKEELESFKEAVENEDLKLISIVTKEQFESMEYKI